MNVGAHTKQIAHQVRNRYLGLCDIVVLAVAAYLSYVLRLEGLDLGIFWPGFFLFTAIAILVTPLVFWRAGVYSRYWRYASVEELLLLAGAVTASAMLVGAITMLGNLFLPGYPPIPRSIPLIFLMVALAATAGPRLAVRLLAPHSKRAAAGPNTREVRVLIMGAGDAGSMIVRELHNNPQLSMRVVGFLDDDPEKQRVQIRRVSVLGTRHDIGRVVHEHRVGCVIIAMPTAPGKVIREIVSVCEHMGVQTKIIPGIYELLGGTVSVNQLRNVEIEDLLRREAVRTDTAAINALVKGKCVLVTGAGGSIGSELCRQALLCNPRHLLLLGHGENSIFEIDNELRRLLAKMGRVAGQGDAPQITALIADIRFADHMRTIFEQYRPEIVFHAAAHKHVPLMELNPAEAITNNVMGTRNLVDASLAVGVEHFVMVSTDKAVNPTSIMGASKRVAELLVRSAAERSGKVYVAVRFGNVLGSRGSVVLTFKQQIASGGPVTVTHPDMVRYFMTIPEAVQLVLQAATLGRGGEIFMLDMGEPVKILDLAHDIIELSGLQVGRDIDVVFTGVRPGEKLFEELFLAEENYEPTRHEKIAIVGNASRIAPPNLDGVTLALEEAAQQHDRRAILSGLRALVPEYHVAAEASNGTRHGARPIGADHVTGPARSRPARRPISLEVGEKA
jgi:FlaA1/EpsC-like NDP-sugar epimerase